MPGTILVIHFFSIKYRELKTYASVAGNCRKIFPHNMKPIPFNEQTGKASGEQLKNDDGSVMGDLPVYLGHGQVISCWQGTIKDRIKFLFTGKIWLSLMSRTVPPQKVGVDFPFANP